MRTFILTLALVLLPYSVQAQDPQTLLMYERDTSKANWVDTIIPCAPDSATMFTIGTVRCMIDSALKAQGRWVPSYWPCSDGGPVRTCTSWVWTMPAPVDTVKP